MIQISISSNKARLIRMLQTAADDLERQKGPNVSHEIYGAQDNDSADEVKIVFDNEDMEGRDDLPVDLIITNVDPDA